MPIRAHGHAHARPALLTSPSAVTPQKEVGLQPPPIPVPGQPGNVAPAQPGAWAFDSQSTYILPNPTFTKGSKLAPFIYMGDRSAAPAARPTGPHAAPACPPLVGLRLLGLRLLSLLSLLGLLLMCFVLLVHGRSRPLFTARWNYTDAFGTSVATYVWLPLFVHPTNPRLVRVLWRDEWRLDDASMYPFAE